MKKVHILLPNGKYIREEEWEYLLEVPETEATEFGDQEADQIIKHLGEGTKVQINDNKDN